MEKYIVSARKYRPSNFNAVVGQEALTTTLKNAIATGKLAHAYLFCGPRGVGKTTCARIFAKTINCLSPLPNGEACDECESCKAFAEQRSYNIHELDAASNNSVEDIKQLMEQVRIPPQIGKYKVFIIDEVHMLSTSAFNAFLKTLEEPPAHTIFILATTEKHKLLPTILSRCQIYDFNRMSIEDIVRNLQAIVEKEGLTAEPEALNVIAQKADGGMRDALSIFDQVVSFTEGKVTYKGVIEDLNVLDYEYYFRLIDFFLANKVSEALLTYDEILRKGFDAPHFINGLANHLRDLLVSQDAQTISLLEVAESVKIRYQQQATKCPTKFLSRAMKLCNQCDLNYRLSNNKRFLVELTLIQLAQLTEEGSEADEGDGRSPKILKPLFKKAAANGMSTPAKQPINEVPQANAQEADKSQTSIQQPSVAQENVTTAHTSTNTNSSNSLGARSKAALHVLKANKLGFSIKRATEAMTQPQTEKSLNGNTLEKESSTKISPQDFPPIDELELSIQWRAFAHQLPQEHTALAQRMLVMKAKELNEEGVYEVVVDNETTYKDLLHIKPKLEKFLRTQLKTPFFTLQIRMAEASEHIAALTQGELYQKMLTTNPALAALREAFGLELT
ncbi:MAG: DNA polymerase III subunit gamma/tau [Bacteroidaceae bacterium]